VLDVVTIIAWDQCTVASDAVKCYNCKGNHLATSKDCSHYREQEKKMLNMVNQYTSSSKPITTTPTLHDCNEFPSLPTMSQRLQDHLQNDFFDQMINVLSSKMEKIIETTTSRLFQKTATKDQENRRVNRHYRKQTRRWLNYL
jgi:hypothetical protein